MVCDWPHPSSLVSSFFFYERSVTSAADVVPTNLGFLLPDRCSGSFCFGLPQVRMGTDKDPEHEDKTGSNPLRQGCPTEEALRRGFSLVYLSRTVSVVLSLVSFLGQ